MGYVLIRCVSGIHAQEHDLLLRNPSCVSCKVHRIQSVEPWSNNKQALAFKIGFDHTPGSFFMR